MTDDLSTRLQAAIACFERDEISAAIDLFVVKWEDIDSARSPGWYGAHCDCGWSTSGNESPLDDAIWTHVLDKHPPQSSAICNSHREIVQLALTCRADYALVASRVAAIDSSSYAERAKARAESHDVFTRLQLAESILSIVARGYGVEET